MYQDHLKNKSFIKNAIPVTLLSEKCIDHWVIEKSVETPRHKKGINFSFPYLLGWLKKNLFFGKVNLPTWISVPFGVKIKEKHYYF